MRIWFGVVQEILQIPIVNAAPQVFLKVRWYNKDIVGKHPAIWGATRIRCTGGESVQRRKLPCQDVCTAANTACSDQP